MAVAYQDTSYGAKNECRIALIGGTGSGKSASGNSILGWKAFESKSSASTVTKKCQFQTAERFDKKLVVAELPGLYDIQQTSDVVTKEIARCVGILTPGPHAFILVVQVGRFTQEEQNIITHLSNIFGEEFFRYLIVLFTRKDDLERDGITIQKYVTEAPDKLKNILQRCNHKYVAFDNTSRGQENDLDAWKLVSMVKDIMNETGKSYFSNDTFERAEREFQRRAEKIRLMGEKKIAQIQEEMKDEQDEIEKQNREARAEKAKTEATTRKLDEEKKRHQEIMKNIRDNDRRRYENEDEGVSKTIGDKILALEKTFWEWIRG